jgi:NOL1/NOP2/fmu family ribosome biogenesis protein
MRQKKKKKVEVRTMKARYWYYKGSDIIGEGREEKGWVNYRTENKGDK